MAERFGARLKYEDELAAEMRQCEEQLELMYLKKKQRKQQKERDEEQRLKEKEKKRARKEEKKRLIKEEIRQLELEEHRLQEAMRQREREYDEKKQLDALKFERMTAEMEKVVAELKEEKSRGDRAREVRRIQRNEETAKRDNARKVREMKRKEAVASREQDEKKEKIYMQPDVKDEILIDQKVEIGFNTTSDESHRSQFPTPIPIPHADDVEVPGICIAESHCGISPLETCSITSASTPLHVATVNIVPSTVIEELQTACSPEPYCDVTRYEATPTLSDATPALLGSDRPVIPRTMKNPVDFNDSQDRIRMPNMCDVKEIPTAFVSESCCDVTSTEAAPSLVHVVPALVVPSHLALNDPLHLTVTDEVDLDGRQDRTLKSVLSELQADPHLSHLQHGCDGPDESVRCSTEVHGVELNHDDTSLCKAAVPQSGTVRVVQVAHIAILYLPESCVDHTAQKSVMLLYYCYANTSVSKIFYCVSLCLLYVMYCSILLRYCTYLSPCLV